MNALPQEAGFLRIFVSFYSLALAADNFPRKLVYPVMGKHQCSFGLLLGLPVGFE